MKHLSCWNILMNHKIQFQLSLAIPNNIECTDYFKCIWCKVILYYPERMLRIFYVFISHPALAPDLYAYPNHKKDLCNIYFYYVLPWITVDTCYILLPTNLGLVWSTWTKGAIWDKHRVPSSGQSLGRPKWDPRAGSRGSCTLPSPFSPRLLVLQLYKGQWPCI